MTKRPPEMVELVTFAQDMDGTLEPDDMGRWVSAEDAVAAIRSLRIKLFRERAKRYQYRYLAMVYVTRGTGIEGDHGQMLRCQRASMRFSAIADAIERGEK